MATKQGGPIESGGYVPAGGSLSEWVNQGRKTGSYVRNVVDCLAHVVPLLTGPGGTTVESERLVVVALDRKGRVLEAAVMTIGSSCATIVDRRQILRWALLKDATSIVLAHNHPSGDPEPSVEDQLATRQVVKACEAVGLKLLDHVIVADGGLFTSMLERGLM